MNDMKIEDLRPAPGGRAHRGLMRKVEPLKNIYDVYDLGRVGEGVGEFLHEYAARRESHNGQLLYVELNEIEAEPRWAEHKAAIDLLRENCGNTFRLYFWW